jgi:GT2 family glycosyltransferase
MDPEHEPFTVLVPERGRPDLLGATLDALRLALERVDLSHEVHILVNGAAASDYALLRRRHSAFRWHLRRRALGFHAAVRIGLEQISTPWVYLLNSDMRLLPEALCRVLPWRDPSIFAIASQIEFADRNRRREETGYTVPVKGPDGQLELHDLIAPDGAVRAHLYAGGGASLFQRAPLQRYLALSAAYAPFYFEDAEWGVQAWADGLRVLYCPASRAVHEHRGTIGHFYSAERVDAVIARNLGHFRWRHGQLFDAPREYAQWRARLAGLRRACSVEHRRARALTRSTLDETRLSNALKQRHPRPATRRRGKLRVLLVSPFAVLPAAHGAARRIVELARAVREHIDWILLHDEHELARGLASADDDCFGEIHPVGGRPHHGESDRFEAHAHDALLDRLLCLLKETKPDILCFEQLECLGLVEKLACDQPLIWTLHDAGRSLDANVQTRVQAAIERVDALVLSTQADLGYWTHPCQLLIENGVRLPQHRLPPSPDDGPLLLVAPLRYEANLRGLLDFLDQAWPQLRLQTPSVRLRVLGGTDARKFWGERMLPAGVTLVDHHVDPNASYREAMLCLNPQTGIEGSALKIAESLAHGRVIVSTHEGARGYESFTHPALVRVSEVAAMTPAIIAMVTKSRVRHILEREAVDAIKPWDWRSRAEPLMSLIKQLDCR